MPLVLETKDVSLLKKFAKKVCSPVPLFSGFFLKAFQSSSHRLGLKSIQVSGLPAHNFFHSEKGKWIFSSDSPLCSWKENARTAVARGTTSTLLFQQAEGTPFPAKKFLPSTSYQACERHELRATPRSFFPASPPFIYRSPKGLETVLDPSPKYTGQLRHCKVPGRDPNQLLGWVYFLKSSFSRPRWIPPHTYRVAKRSQTAGLRLLLLPRWF